MDRRDACPTLPACDSKLDPASPISNPGLREVADFFERFVPLGNVFLGKRFEFFEAERLYRITGKQTAVNHRFFEVCEFELSFSKTRQIAGKSSGECVSCPGRIMDILQRVRATAEKLVVAEQQTAVLPFFDCDILRPELNQFLPGLDQTCFLR